MKMEDLVKKIVWILLFENYYLCRENSYSKLYKIVNLLGGDGK